LDWQQRRRHPAGIRCHPRRRNPFAPHALPTAPREPPPITAACADSGMLTICSAALTTTSPLATISISSSLPSRRTAAARSTESPETPTALPATSVALFPPEVAMGLDKQQIIDDAVAMAEKLDLGENEVAMLGVR